jgi:hypothetical protein
VQLFRRDFRELILQPIAGLEEPGNDRHAEREKSKRDGHAQSDMHVGDIEEAPAESRNQIDQRVEQRDRAPERRQHVRRIKGAAEKRQRRDDQERHDLQLLEIVGPQSKNEAEQAETDRGRHQESHHPARMHDTDRHEQPRRGENDAAEND